MDDQKAYSFGHDLIMDDIGKIGPEFDNKNLRHAPAVLSGMLTALMAHVYYQAPSPEAADELISGARKEAEEAVREAGGFD